MKNGIILEGAEQQFKSTVAQKLANLTKMPIIHMGKDYGKNSQGEFDYFNGYFADIDFYNTGLIFDRSYISELVYGPLIRKECKITPELQIKIEEKFKNLNYLAILLHRNDFKWKNEDSDGKLRNEYVTAEQNVLIRQKYIEVFNQITLKKAVIDPSDSQCINDIFNLWKSMKILKE